MCCDALTLCSVCCAELYQPFHSAMTVFDVYTQLKISRWACVSTTHITQQRAVIQMLSWRANTPGLSCKLNSSQGLINRSNMTLMRQQETHNNSCNAKA